MQAAELDLPPIPNVEHLAAYLFEVGPTTGEQAITWQEVRAWRREIGIELSEFEVVTLVAMSREYLSWIHKAKNPECLPPYRIEKSTEQKKAASLAMKNRRRNT